MTKEASGRPEPGKSKARINLERASILLIDNALGLEILAHIFTGFGVRSLFRCQTAADAMEVAASRPLDLIVTEAVLRDQEGYDFIRTIRQNLKYESNRFTPVILLSAHTAIGKVNKARDCGANFFVAKPIAPRIIIDRLLWVSKESRQYLQTDSYAGPDRRFHQEDLQAGHIGRRREDRQKLELEAANAEASDTETPGPQTPVKEQSQ